MKLQEVSISTNFVARPPTLVSIAVILVLILFTVSSILSIFGITFLGIARLQVGCWIVWALIVVVLVVHGTLLGFGIRSVFVVAE